MINEFFDWIYHNQNAFSFLLFIFTLALVFFIISIGAMFACLAAPAKLIGFALLMFAILFSIFIVWYVKVYKK